MKKTTFSKNLFVLICLLSIGISYSQDKNSDRTIFGKPVSAYRTNPDNGYIRCASTEYEESLQQNDHKRLTDAQFEAWVTPLVQHYREMQSVSSQSGGIITIPVVIHVIHAGQAVGVAPNITDAQVISQITVMNNDYRRLAGTPGFNTNPVGADTQIQFALAQQDPNGNPTNGIDRVNLCQASWSTAEINATVKPTTIWDPNLYLNMWSVNFTDATLLGYAQFPSSSGLDGLNASGGAANTDGVVSNFSTFGSIDYNDGTFLLNAPYNKGRTMTHEVGHWLGLRHIWGDGACASDYCADTPTHHTENYGCPTVTSCTTGLEMVQNYMDYTDDSCMNIFTQNQKDRMVVVMNNSPRRSGLKTSTMDVPMTLFPNDAEVRVENVCSASGSSCSTAAVQKITLYNRGTSAMTSVTLSYSVGGAPENTYTWTGNLATHKFATFDMPVNSPVGGSIAVTVTNVNGSADQRGSNDYAEGTFELPVAPSNYTFNNVVFRLQRDKYGLETTWNIKNSSGTTLYSGGPYTNTTTLPALITQNWTLPSNQCYIFTINDTYGDGICCTEGNGYYNIKSTDGTVTLAAFSNFSNSQSRAFSINLLGNEDFETLAGVYVYPNPTRGMLNIAIPDGFGLPEKFTVMNYLGQTIAQKEISSANDLSVNTSSFSSGVYFITVVKGADKKTMRFIKE